MLFKIFNKEGKHKEGKHEKSAEQLDKLKAESLALERRKKAELEQLRKKELEELMQLDVEARKTLQGEFKKRYLLAKELGLERQAEIARIEGITNTTYIDLAEESWLICKAVVCKLGYSVGGTHYNRPVANDVYSTVSEFPGAMQYGAMLRYKELKGQFDGIKILHMDVGSDPTMYGIKKWKEETLHFRIMTWG